jgi:hypothetical protein
MDAFWAVPEWAPAEESHLLGGISPVTKISYGAGSMVYSTFDADASEVLRLDFTPEFVTAGGKPLPKRADLTQPGYTFDEKTQVMRVRHENARDIAIQGSGGNAPVRIVTFDDPHFAAGTVLDGFYPSAPIAWSDSQWQIAVPGGKFATFHVVLKDASTESASIWFSAPQIFAGIDIYNGGTSDGVVNISSPETRAVSVTIKPGELRRVRTAWRDSSSVVNFRFLHGEGLHFDNLAWIHN